MEVDIHVLEDEVNVAVVASWNDALELDDVGVAELTKEHDLAVGALSIGGVAKGIEVLLQGSYASVLTVDDLPHMSIRPTAYLFHHLVLFQHMPLFVRYCRFRRRPWSPQQLRRC